MNQQQVPPEAVEPEASKPPSALAWTGLLLSIVGLLLTFCAWPAAILCLAGAVVSVMALQQRKGVAVAGIATGVVGIIFAVIMVLFVNVISPAGTQTPTPPEPEMTPGPP